MSKDSSEEKLTYSSGWNAAPGNSRAGVCHRGLVWGAPGAGWVPGTPSSRRMPPAWLKAPAAGAATVKPLGQMNRDPSLVTIAIHAEQPH